jgi:hypothetical protein
MPVAYNPDTNEALVFDPESGWLPTKLAMNPETGDRAAFDGTNWVPIKTNPTPNPAAVAEAQWRQGNKIPNPQQPPERDDMGRLLGAIGGQIKERWDNFKKPDLGIFGDPSAAHDNPELFARQLEEASKLLPFAITGAPAIMATQAGRVASAPRGAISAGPNPAMPSLPPGGVNFQTNAPSSPQGVQAPRPISPLPPTEQPIGPAASIPPLPIEPVVRPKTGARLLPPETSHALPPEPPEIRAGRASGGAAASGHNPLSDLSPGAEALLRKAVGQDNLSPYMVEQRISEMSPHQFFAEVSPNMQSHASGLHASGGAARNEIEMPFVERKAETPQRMAVLFNDALGKEVNGPQFMRRLKDARETQGSGAWKDFQSTPIPPFPGMAQLMERLDAAGALKAATKAQREWGHRVNNQYETATGIRVKPEILGGAPGPITEVPTAGTFQFAKEHLDELIKSAIEKGQDGRVARYSAIKNDLVNAIDNHPEKTIAGKWRAAREAWTGPTQMMAAYRLGERLLTGHINKYDLPIITESYGLREKHALAAGIRSDLENRLGRPGPQELPVIKQMLGKNNQEKVAYVIGDDKAEKLFAALLHEHHMHFSHDQTIRNSMTAARMAAQKFWEPPESTLPGGIPMSVSGLKRAAVDTALSAISNRRAAKQAKEFEKIREEVARILTLQGAERDAALHYLTTPKPKMGVFGP